MNSLFLTPSGQGRKERGIISITPTKPRIEPQAKKNWPGWALDIEKSRKRQPSDTGVGDTLVHIIGDKFSAKFKALTKAMGINCGCTDRQSWLNARFPYL